MALGGYWGPWAGRGDKWGQREKEQSREARRSLRVELLALLDSSPWPAQASVSLGQAKGSCVPGSAGGTEPRPHPLQTTAVAWGRSVVL